MREPREFESVFHISHAMFQLTDHGVVPEIGDDLGGLVVPLINGGAAVLCGISDGPVRVRAQASDSAPDPETAAWDEMQESPDGGLPDPGLAGPARPAERADRHDIAVRIDAPASAG